VTFKLPPDGIGMLLGSRVWGGAKPVTADSICPGYPAPEGLKNKSTPNQVSGL
jgi:hypothetical protein